MEIWHHTLSIAERLFRHPSHLVMFLLVMTCFDSPSHASGRSDDAQISIVENRSGYRSRTNYADMAAAVNAATEHTTIHLKEGVHVIDNPVVLARPGMRIKGQGRETTTVRPRNAGKPMFEFKADNVGVEHLSMDAELENGRARANFGVHIKEGYAHSRVLNTQISNTGASAIIGFEISDSKVVGNIILNSGDDGIQKRGDRLTISDNIIVDYFDEAIDVLGTDVVVTNNYVKSGRIGIVVGGATNAVVACNTAEDHFHAGIFVESKWRGKISHNTVKDSVESAYVLNSLEVIDSNRATGNHRVGFEIKNVREGDIVRNAVVGARIGFDLVQSSGNLMHGNQYSGDGEAVKSDQDSPHSDLQKSLLSVAGETISNADELCQTKGNSERFFSDETAPRADKEKIIESLLGRSDQHVAKSRARLGALHATGESERDKEVAAGLVSFLSRKNPGFVSIHVKGNVKTSQITEDLYTTLKGSGRLGIGLVRMPIKMLRGGSRAIFPVWHLMVGDKEVAIVTVRPSGIGAHILFTENGRSRHKRLLTLSLSRVAHQLNSTSGFKLQSLYRDRKNWILVALPLLLGIIGLAVMWRVKKKNG
jgi:hypothetical protein